jgi:hypothetical protein
VSPEALRILADGLVQFQQDYCQPTHRRPAMDFQRQRRHTEIASLLRVVRTLLAKRRTQGWQPPPLRSGNDAAGRHVDEEA